MVVSPKKASCMHIIRPKGSLKRVIYTDGSSNFLKCCGVAAIAAISLSLLQSHGNAYNIVLN